MCKGVLTEMARFWQRTKETVTAPAQYIQTTDSVSRPMAVMMSLLGVFLVGVLLVSLFFVGRWGYRELTANDTATPTTGQISTGEPTQAPGGTPDASGATITNRTPGASTSTNDVQNSASPRGTTGATTTVTGGSAAARPSTSTPTAVPNTGPENLIALFVVTAVISALAHRVYLQKRL